MRRLHWLAKQFERRLEVLLQMANARPDPPEKKDGDDKASTCSGLVKREGFVTELRSRIQAWKFTQQTIQPRTLQRLMTEGGMTVKQAIREEISEGETVPESPQIATINALLTILSKIRNFL